MVQHFVAQVHRLTFVPDHQVGIGTNGDAALARIQPIHPGGISGSQRNKALRRDAPTAHAFGPEQCHAGFDTGNAVGDLVERHLFSVGLLAIRAIEAKGCVV
ncbi:hypothetical protein D3C76_735690 [compost metagenome]